MRVSESAHWLEWQDWADPILQMPYGIKDSQLHIPDVPGLGLERQAKKTYVVRCGDLFCPITVLAEKLRRDDHPSRVIEAFRALQGRAAGVLGLQPRLDRRGRNVPRSRHTCLES